MGESELLGIVRDCNVQYATLFGQMITINFAMIVAIYYFLHRASVKLKLAAFLFYLIGMLSLVGLILTQANIKNYCDPCACGVAARPSVVGRRQLSRLPHQLAGRGHGGLHEHFNVGHGGGDRLFAFLVARRARRAALSGFGGLGGVAAKPPEQPNGRTAASNPP